MQPPASRFAWNGDVSLACQVAGEGPTDLLYLQGYARTSTSTGRARTWRGSSGRSHSTPGGRVSGEVERLDDKLGGLAVNIGARVASLAGPSEVLVSQTVRDLMSARTSCSSIVGSTG